MKAFSYTYSLPYIAFIIFLIVLMLWEFHKINKSKDIKQIRYLTIIGYLFFFGLRGYVSTDFYLYYPFFENLPTLWSGKNIFISDYYEPGFVVYSSIIKSVFNDYFIWVFINTVIDVIILDIIFRRYSKYYVLCFLLFFVMLGFVLEINNFRNIKAIILFLLSLKYIQQRKILPYMLLNVLGIFFHTSSFFFLPLYFFLHKRISRKLLIIIFIIGNILFLTQAKVMMPLINLITENISGTAIFRVANYISDELYGNSRGISLGYAERVLTYVLVIVFYNRLAANKDSNILFANSYVLYFIAWFYFSDIFIFSDRVSLLFTYSYWLVYPNIYEIIKIRSYRKLFLRICIVFLPLKMAVQTSDILSKYDNIVFGIEDYESRKRIVETYLSETQKKLNLNKK